MNWRRVSIVIIRGSLFLYFAGVRVGRRVHHAFHSAILELSLKTQMRIRYVQGSLLGTSGETNE